MGRCRVCPVIPPSKYTLSAHPQGQASRRAIAKLKCTINTNRFTLRLCACGKRRGRRERGKEANQVKGPTHRKMPSAAVLAAGYRLELARREGLVRARPATVTLAAWAMALKVSFLVHNSRCRSWTHPRRHRTAAGLCGFACPYCTGRRTGTRLPQWGRFRSPRCHWVPMRSSSASMYSRDSTSEMLGVRSM